MSSGWPSLSYADWGPCCDTVHALTQLLGKLALATAPPEPQLQHAALRLTARGWETAPLPAPDGSGMFGVVLDLRRHRVTVEAHESVDVDVTGRSVAAITGDVQAAVGRLVGRVSINPAPQEVPWSVALDADEEHRHYEPDQVAAYFAAATQAALVLTAYRAPFRGRSTPVNAWWGSFDLAVNLFSGRSAAPPSEDFIMRNAMDVQEVAVGWWPGDPNHPGAAFYAYAHPAPDGYADATLEPRAAHWDARLGEFILDWEDVRTAGRPGADALAFARSAFAHSCAACAWPVDLAATIDQPPVV